MIEKRLILLVSLVLLVFLSSCAQQVFPFGGRLPDNKGQHIDTLSYLEDVSILEAILTEEVENLLFKFISEESTLDKLINRRGVLWEECRRSRQMSWDKKSLGILDEKITRREDLYGDFEEINDRMDPSNLHLLSEWATKLFAVFVKDNEIDFFIERIDDKVLMNEFKK